MKRIALLMIVFASTIAVHSQEDLNIKYMLRGYFYANSSVEDSLAPGGFADWGNNPIKMNEKNSFADDKVDLFIDVLADTTFNDDYNGYLLYLSNTTDSTAVFSGQDSRIDIKAQAWVDGSWQDIEYLPGSWCGNSYHTIYLKSREYWEFAVPRYDGKTKTRIRYVLQYGDILLMSNEYNGGINRKQLTEMQGHSPQSIMDPYEE